MSDKMTENKFICIMCPLGCEVTVHSDSKGDIKEILGNKCEKGAAYVKEEFTSPRRVLTTTITMAADQLGRLPVKTSAPIPKDKLLECMAVIGKLKLSSMVKAGDIIVHDILELGVDVIATKDLF
jgi:CxxC motif-containing protein